MLREEKCIAADILHRRGLRLVVIRKELQRQKTAPKRSAESPLLGKTSRDLTKAALDGQLAQVVGRGQELDEVIEVLCSRDRRNPILVGERGSGKTSIVEGVAQRIADGHVPPRLIDNRILALDLPLIVQWTKDRQKFEERLEAVVKEMVDASGAIIFLDDLQTFVGSGPPGAAEIMKPAILSGEIQCIITATPIGYRELLQTIPWLGPCFRKISVDPLNEDNLFRVLQDRRERYEKFHEVSYTDEALRCAVRCSVRYFSDGALLIKATEILDAAGSRVKVRQASVPPEIAEARKRIKFITHRMEIAIANHEFEKARFYADEEAKERDKVRVLGEKYGRDDSNTGVVASEDVENLVSRWTGVPIKSIRAEEFARQLVDPASGTHKGPSLRVFLCHSSEDKLAVRDLYKQLRQRQIDPWLDEENLLPGQDWDYEITNAVHSSHVVIVCLSANSVSKAGYSQKEIKKVLDVADEQPEGTIYVIPLKLEECDVPSRLRQWQWVNLFEEKGFERLMHALLKRARGAGIPLQ
jgi:ATP-dependent Clp protease ATP-binding subunit ClpC